MMWLSETFELAFQRVFFQQIDFLNLSLSEDNFNLWEKNKTFQRNIALISIDWHFVLALISSDMTNPAHFEFSRVPRSLSDCVYYRDLTFYAHVIIEKIIQISNASNTQNVNRWMNDRKKNKKIESEHLSYISYS